MAATEKEPVVSYLHMLRGLIYGWYRAPRELVWIFGMMIYLALVAAHLMALREVRSNDPDGIEIQENLNAQGMPLDGIPLFPQGVGRSAVRAVDTALFPHPTAG